MTEEQQKEELSRAYVWAVAARAGMSCATIHVDDDSVDLTIQASGKLVPDARWASPRLDVQLKATSQGGILHPEWLSFPLPRKNYDDLRAARACPIILVVLLLPEADEEWLAFNEEQMISRRCAYWMSLSDARETSNNASVTVRVPRRNRFTDESLRGMMLRIARGELP